MRSRQRWFSRFTSPPTRRGRQTCRPWSEPLESRTLLTTFTVTNTDDSGPGSLRQAIIDAAFMFGDDVIVFDPGVTGTIALTSGPLRIGGTASVGGLRIEGPGADVLTIDGGDAQRLLTMITTSFTFLNPVEIAGLTFTGGASDESGGAILLGPNSDLTLTDVAVVGNQADGDGGAIFARSGSELTIVGSTISGNTAGGSGGGIRVGRYAEITILESTVSGNVAGDRGGGLFNDRNEINVEATTVSGNRAEVHGGGIANEGSLLAIVDSTISGNSAAKRGGGVFNVGRRDVVSGTEIDRIGEVVLTQSTVFENRADADGSGSGTGGGVFSADNLRARVVLNNSVVAGNLLGDGATADNLDGKIPLGAGNIVGSGAVTVDPTGNQIGVDDPQLGPLQDNGGPTRTHAPLASSPAIDAGFFLPLQGTDQRGVSRFQGRFPDVGAFEVEADSLEFEDAGLVVTTLNDALDPFDGQTSLRDALAFAAGQMGDDVVRFADGLSGTILVASPVGAIVLDDPSGALTIEGPSPDVLAIAGSGDSRVFEVNAGTNATITGLTITGGSTTGDGGGIFNEGTLALVDSVVSGNTAGANGGGIAIRGSQDLFWEYSSPYIEVLRSPFVFADLTVVRSTIHGNRAGGDGGGIVMLDVSGLTLVNATVSGNTSGGDGGGIIDRRNVTEFMEAFGNVGGPSDPPPLIIQSTIVENVASGLGGGLSESMVGRLGFWLTQSIVAGNTASMAPDISGGVSIRDDVGRNLVGIADGATGLASGDILIGTATDPVDPLLGPLQDNGGPTPTHALLEGSPAIDAGQDVLVAGPQGDPLTTDQRGEGFARIQGRSVDMGAFESSLAGPETEIPSLVVDLLEDRVDPFDGRTSLREAVRFSFDQAGADTIRFADGMLGTITLSGAPIVLGAVDASTTIEGSGSNLLTIDGAGLSGVVSVQPDVNATITGLTIRGGSTTDSGGGIDSRGMLTLVDLVVVANTAVISGGGISNDGGELVISDSTVAGNTSFREGGGVAISHLLGQSTTITNTTISDNTAISRSGGGLYTSFGAITVSGSTIEGNVSGGSGGGILSSSNLSLVESIVVGNSSRFEGGGIYNLFRFLSVKNSLISGNQSDLFGGGGISSNGALEISGTMIIGNSSSESGGGLDSFGTTTVTDSTIWGNRADDNGGGISVRGIGSFDM